MAKSGVWKTLKNPKFEEILIFEGCSGSMMPKMHSGGVQNIFEKFLNFFHFFITPCAFSARILNFLAKNEPKIAYCGVWETLKNPNFEEILVFEGCYGSRMPKMHSGEVSNIFEKFLNFFQFFTIPWPISARILKFFGPK